MEDLLIIGGALALVLLLGQGGSASLTVSANTQAPTAPGLATPISISGGAIVPGGYLGAPKGIGNWFGGLAGGLSGAGLPTTISPPAQPTPPPAVVGGAAGNAGTGGIPLGALRVGIGPILPTSIPNRTGWLLQHKLPNNGFGRSPGISRGVPVSFA